MKIHFHQSTLTYPAAESVLAEVSAALNEAAVHIFPAYFLWGLDPGELVRDPDAQQSYHHLAKQLSDLAAQANLNLAASASPALIIAPGVNVRGEAEFLCLTEGQGGRWVTGPSALSTLLSKVLGRKTLCAYGAEPFLEEAAIYLRWPTQPCSILRPNLPPADFKGAYFSLSPVGWSYAQQWQ
ncbi:MAG: hypothetical protein J6Y94_07420, partial [Bacteriovoracaceae bacterium]|nr:hypothetical protein [Bacteriovoracaceae bacterium]